MDSKKILVVEDEPTQRRMLSAMLQRDGYEVVEASDGRQGVDLYLADPAIRLVITDLVMPQMDGFQLIEAIRQQDVSYAYIIVLTGLKNKESLVRALSLGANDYLTKPVFQNELSLRLASARCLLRLEGQGELIAAMVKLSGARSGETGTHLDRVKSYSTILAGDLLQNHPELGLNASLVDDIANVTPLHDIGKVAIPDNILHKPGRLTMEEFEVMKSHAAIGGNILKDIYERTNSVYLRLAYEVAMYHHERWDGKGYPAGLQGNEIPLAARIMALADVFDALTAQRCYKDAFAYNKAKAIVVEEKGTHFDPMIVEAYLRHEEEWVEVLAHHQENGI